MVKDDVITLLRVFKANYPFAYKGMTKEDKNDIADLWTTQFQEYPTKIVTEAVHAYISDNNNFPPTVGNIKEKIRLITESPQLTEMEAWVIVSKAICDSMYHAQEHFDRFPDIIKNIIRQPEQLRMWGQMDVDTVNSVVQSNFMRSYKSMSQHQEQLNRLPESTKTLIEELKNKFLLGVST